MLRYFSASALYTGKSVFTLSIFSLVALHVSNTTASAPSSSITFIVLSLTPPLGHPVTSILGFLEGFPL